MKNLVEFINENKVSDIDELADITVDFLKYRNFKNLDGNVEELLDSIESRIRKINIKAANKFNKIIYDRLHDF